MSFKPSKRGILERGSGVSDDVEAREQQMYADDNYHADNSGHFLKIHENHNPVLTQNTKIVPKGREVSKQLCLNNSSIGNTSVLYQSHDNPAFQYDDGSVGVIEGAECDVFDDIATMQTDVYLETVGNNDYAQFREQTYESDYSNTTKNKNNQHVIELCDYTNPAEYHKQANSVSPNMIFERMSESTTLCIPALRDQGNHAISDTRQNDLGGYLDQSQNETSAPHQKSSDNSPCPQSPSHAQIDVDNVKVVHRSQPEGQRPARPHSRSVSSVSSLASRADSQKTPGSVSQAVHRSHSMRVPPTVVPSKPKPRSLLRDLSFADTDTTTVRNYGTLRGDIFMPRRQAESIDEDDTADIPIQMLPDLEAHLMNLMQELLGRGKVHQVAVLEREGGSVLVSLPPWELSRRDRIGLVKAATCSLQNMLRLAVGQENYTFFKHGTDKVMGRCGERVLVAQKTNSCVVVGVADNNIPGSCLYEVSELARTMVNKGW